jgi:hypothetical protein
MLGAGQIDISMTKRQHAPYVHVEYDVIRGVKIEAMGESKHNKMKNR